VVAPDCGRWRAILIVQLRRDGKYGSAGGGQVERCRLWPGGWLLAGSGRSGPADSHSDGHAYRDRDSDDYASSDRNRDADSHSYGNRDTHGYSYRNRDSDGYSSGDRDSDANLGCAPHSAAGDLEKRLGALRRSWGAGHRILVGKGCPPPTDDGVF
jgi:hypothetical protein